MKNNLTDFWEKEVPKGHKHFIDMMDNEKVDRLKSRVKSCILDNLDFSKIKTSYDWGCGGGLHTKTLSELCDVTPLDISPESLKMCESYSGIGGKLIPTELKGFSLPRVDLLFCVDVVHHFPSLEYFLEVCGIWKLISPEYICIQYKSSDYIMDNPDYFSNTNYIHSLFLTKKSIISEFSSYEELSYSEELSKNGEITHGFIVLKKK